VPGPLRSPRFVATAGLVLLWCAAGTLLALWFSGRVHDWAVQTDEMQYAKLALAVWETGSPLPSLHETSVSLANQLYPLLLAPIYGPLSSTDAFHGAHVLNAVVMTSAVFPAYLLGRELLPRAWSFAVAVLTVTVPWMVLTGFVMSESVAYPAFLWAMLAFQRTIVAPTPRRDLLAVAALGVAILARTQFSALAIVLPAAVLGHELGLALAAGAGGIRRRLATAVRAAVVGHSMLLALYGVAAAVAAGLVLGGYRLFGAYATTVEGGSILPSGVLWSAVQHLAIVGIGSGFLPLLLGGGWMLAGVVRPTGRSRRGFATLSLLTVSALAFETASFDLRFGGEDILRDRYLFYVVPLLLVASAAALTEGWRLPLAVGVASTTVLFAAGVHGLPFTTFPGLSVDSPVSIFNETLIDQSGGLGTGTFATLVVVLLGLALVAALLLSPRMPLALVAFAATLVFSSLVLRSEVERVLNGNGLTGRPLGESAGVVLDWVDSVLPEDETAALVAFPLSSAWGVSAIQFWDVEFWNRTLTQAYVAPNGNFTYTPFPVRTLAFDPLTGVTEGTSDAPRYVVSVPDDPRFGLAGSEVALNVGLRVLEAERPYRAAWSSSGLQADGWTTPGRPVPIRVYGRAGASPEVQRIRLRLTAPVEGAATYRLEAETANRTGSVSAGKTTEETVLVCVGPRTPVDVTVTTSESTVGEGPPLGPEPGPRRRVGLRLGPIVVEPTGQPCGE
jgi:hypothetical protein